MEHEFYECPEYLSNTPAEVERTEEYEYEVQFWDSELFYFMIVRPGAFFVQLNWIELCWIPVATFSFIFL